MQNAIFVHSCTIMHSFFQLLSNPWPWYVSGPLIGLCVPVLLILGNKPLGISSTLKQFCAMCFPANIEFFKFDWKAGMWKVYFVAGLFIGGFIGGFILNDPNLAVLSPSTISDINAMGVSHQQGILPAEIFSWSTLFTWKNLLIVAGGSFLVGFGTRYAGGCTSGHGIYGLATFQLPSLIAVITFFAFGILSANFLLPLILK